jgi:hypothetical protein
MSNQRGDRYTCSDPNCGCVIEVKEPSASGTLRAKATDARTAATPIESDAGYADATDNLNDRGHGVPAAGNVSDRGFRSESISTTGDFGKQGASGEGIFGTVGADSDHIHTEGRYGSRLPRKSAFAETAGEPRTFPATGRRTEASIRCFCGAEMRPTGAAERARGASA